MAIFSLVASACMSTMMASAAWPSGQAFSSRSMAAKGSSRASMNTRPSRFTTMTLWPCSVVNICDPRPGVSARIG